MPSPVYCVKVDWRAINASRGREGRRIWPYPGRGICFISFLLPYPSGKVSCAFHSIGSVVQSGFKSQCIDGVLLIETHQICERAANGDLGRVAGYRVACVSLLGASLGIARRTRRRVALSIHPFRMALRSRGIHPRCSVTVNVAFSVISISDQISDSMARCQSTEAQQDET